MSLILLMVVAKSMAIRSPRGRRGVSCWSICSSSSLSLSSDSQSLLFLTCNWDSINKSGRNAASSRMLMLSIRRWRIGAT
jgi:hypothetical protein